MSADGSPDSTVGNGFQEVGFTTAIGTYDKVASSIKVKIPCLIITIIPQDNSLQDQSLRPQWHQ